MGSENVIRRGADKEFKMVPGKQKVGTSRLWVAHQQNDVRQEA
ncbi:hypothetical protein GCM10017559_64470 [Streptosporangium longisporum]|uniref:Uncharacterized protein n=1 Tax=Streptosporangium longisporum TaxID=46187 RepID=A0ABP6L507_9ACTN